MATIKKYKVTRENKKDEKFAPQAQAILDAIKTYNEPVERSVLLAGLEKSGVLKTKQTPARVFSFFRPKLVESGILKELKETVAAEKPAKEPKATKEAKPAKSKKTEQKA